MITKDGTTVLGSNGEQVAKLAAARRILERARAMLDDQSEIKPPTPPSPPAR
jgi:hypothetical protein